MISIPRDIYYRGRKLNASYGLYGIQELKKEIYSLTGIPIDRYITIDMYAFIEAVDIFGGIDIVLEESLTDPTYIIRDNGKWHTLHYPAGYHHLDGLGALRIARSRHTSSDFERSERQQKILFSVIEKFKSSSGLEAANLLKVLLKYCHTDFSLAELMNYYIRFNDYAVGKQAVLNTDNVLYHTYSNMYYLDEKTEFDDDFDKGSWILLPRGDWDIVQNYIQSLLYGGKPE
jgi:LCP family protein required for cell wall assembly